MVDARPLERAGIQLRRQVSLAPLTTMKVGGPAEYFAVAESLADLAALVAWAHAVEMPYFVLGGGSNMLISDAGIRGLVIHNRSRQVRITSSDGTEMQAPRSDEPERLLIAESGAAMAGAARTSVRAGLSGLEWGVSVPGTIGGAVVGNAGAHGGEVKDNLETVVALDEEGATVTYSCQHLHYAYRSSSLKQASPLRAGFRPVVLTATFRLKTADAATVRSRADAFLAQRRKSQPVEPSLGSTFVNPSGDFAGRLIEAAGLKGHGCGGIQVSHTHANFLINPGGVGTASADDVLALIRHIQTVVAAQFGVTLEPEVQFAGEWQTEG